MRHRLIIEGHAAQLDFWGDASPWRAYVGGIGSGKTWAGAVEILRQPAHSHGAVIAPTYPMLRDATLRSFLALCAEADLIASHNESRLETRLRNGTVILWRSADNPDRLRGLNLGWVWIDEAAFCDASTWTIALGRLRLPPSRAWVTTTPRGKNWIYGVFCAGDSKARLIQSRTGDNPFLPPDFVGLVRSQYGEQFAAQELDGEFIDWSGGIFKREWIRAIAPHALPRDLRWVRAWDTATSAKTTADETAGVKAALDRAGNLYLAAPIAGRWEGPEALEVIVQTALADTRAVPVGVEAVAAQIHAFQHLQRDPRLAAHRLLPLSRTTDKVSAALPWCARASGGRLYLVEGSDWSGWVDQWVAFPAAKHDDRVDAVSHAVLLAADDPTAWAAALRS